MKKINFACSVLLLILVMLSITVSAIDTPWLPLNPDSEITTDEEVETDAETADSSTESKEESTIPNVNILNETNDATNQTLDSQKNSNEESKKTGCGSTIGMCTVLIVSVSVAMVCTQKARKENL